MWEDASSNITWFIYDDDHVLFWKDTWVRGSGGLMNYSSNGVPYTKMKFPLSHYLFNENWNWGLYNKFCLKIFVIRQQGLNPLQMTNMIFLDGI